MASRWLVDRVTISDVSFASGTRPLGKASTTTTTAVDIPALIRSELVELVDAQNVRRSVRELRVWIDDSDVAVSAGQRLTVTGSGDVTLLDRGGEIIDVERDTIRATRRVTVRLGNDA